MERGIQTAEVPEAIELGPIQASGGVECGAARSSVGRNLGAAPEILLRSGADASR